MKFLGILLIVLGILAMVVPSISFTRKEKALDIGPIEVVTKKPESFSFGPLMGITFLAVGGAILVAGAITGKK